jgi:hypothetical protein
MELNSMEQKEIYSSKEMSTLSQPVVFISQPKAKVALTALSLVATGLAASIPNAAIATATQNSAQPIVFTSQPTSSEFVAGDKLQQYEARLSKELGMDKFSLRKSGGCDSGTTSGQGASDCDD